MARSVFALPIKGDRPSALTDLDQIAAELLSEGQAATLSAARISVLLSKIRAHRAELVSVIADLHDRPSTGNAQLERVNADLSNKAIKGLAQVDQLIQLIEAVDPEKLKP